MTKLSVIIPTIGRESLAAAVRSCNGADEIVVVFDGCPVQELPGPVVTATVSGGDNGYTARRKGMELATGTHLAFLDDDDQYMAGALNVMKPACCDRPVIFRMDHPEHGILWREPKLEFGNVGTPMFLVPNRPEKLGHWVAHAPGLKEPGGDFTFISTCRMGEPIWREEVVAKIRPNELTVSIVTPWQNHLELLPDYLGAVNMRHSRDELIVVDNASDPQLNFAAVRLEENHGFAGGSNTGLREANCDAVLFLNNDVAMASPDWLERIRSVLEPGVLVGMLRYDRHADVDGTSFPYLDGWCLAGMRDDLLELGGFDETFTEPAYYSDNDLCLRARLEGMTLREVPMGLRHKTSQTSGGQNAQTEKAVAENYVIYSQRAKAAA